MEININQLRDLTIEATDGHIGKVKDFYFDDISWDIRYLIIESGNWFSDRSVLISPTSIIHTDWQKGIISARLTKEQVKNSPNIDTHMPVSRWQETELYQHYGWPEYWDEGHYAGNSLGVSSPFPIFSQKTGLEEDKTHDINFESHLRSTEMVKDYHIQAVDGSIGHLIDYIVDDKTWKIKFIVVDTRNWLEGHAVLISVNHVDRIEWDNSKVYVNMLKILVEKSLRFKELDYVGLGTSLKDS